MNDFCVYCHTSPSNKKYIGISRNPIKRWSNGKGYAKNYRFYRAIQKYGWESFTHEIIASNLSYKEACDLERKLIFELKLTDFNYGYNLRDGGDGSFSEESRKKMSQSRIGNKNNLGKKLTDKQKKKISNSLKKYYESHYSEESQHKKKTKSRNGPRNILGENNPSSKAVCCLDLNNNLLKIYPYMKLASIELSVDLSSIVKCCKHKAKTAGGHKWIYRSEYEKNLKEINYTSDQP